MTHLDDRQKARLADVARAWKAQRIAMQELMEEQAKEQERLSATMYEEVVKATALALEASVPKRKLGPAVGTANYTANRKALHEDALALVATYKPTVEIGAQASEEIDLRDMAQGAVWAHNLSLTYIGEDREMSKFAVKDPAGLVAELYQGELFPACYEDGVTPALETALLDQEEIIMKKMREAKNA